MSASGRSADLPSSIKEFLAELEDLLENLGRDLGAMEELLAEEKEDPDLVNGVFRSFHTIKGLAGMLSMGEISGLAHALEDLLDAIRLGRATLGEGVLEVLYRGVEMLNAMAKKVSAGGTARVDGVEAFLRRIESVLDAPEEGGSRKAAPRIHLSDEIIKTLTEYEEHRLRESIKTGRNLYFIRRSFSFESFDSELNALLTALKGEGEVISTLPSSSSDDPTAIRFDLLWSTTLDTAAAIGKFSFAEGEISPIRYDKPEDMAEEDREPVSSTLRSLSQTVRVDIKRLDNLMNIVGELIIYKTHLNEISRDFIGREGATATNLGLSKTVKSLERTLNLLQKGVIEARMVPIGQMFGKLNRIVRKLCRDMDKEIELKISGEDTELDKLVIEDMADPLLHLIRNAVDHGIEIPADRTGAGKPPRGTISLRAYQKGNHVVIEIEDDGAGIDVKKVRKVAEKKGLIERSAVLDDQQILSVLFLPGFSTADSVTEVSGRGVGMDVVKNNVSRLRGMIDIDSRPGRGTRVTITLPMTLAIIQALMVRVAGETLAIPIGSVLESLKVAIDQIRKVENKEVIHLRDSILPLLRLDDYFSMRPRTARPVSVNLYVVVVGLAEKRLGIVVDSLRGQHEIVIKTLGTLLKPVRGIAGATELGDRRAILVLDVGGLIQEVTFAV
jgi:two-component system chemotaxis sensor kinase CheA